MRNIIKDIFVHGWIELIKENNQFKIDNIELIPESFFCAAYHGWMHNAELKVEAMYGNWCKLVEKIYPYVESVYMKKIYVKGADGNNYLFTFIKLTNGTDIEIGQYIKMQYGKWKPINLDPYQCTE